ncbi:MAG TPA: hypothetical protein PKL77_03440 [Candidatus Omnitrophota bacterium]|nr:hypothetical protein [Candidatus Omnitrophota bacterium]HPT08021.1 hypothetical protein [Candidatus Omnitrophota bacterium]
MRFRIVRYSVVFLLFFVPATAFSYQFDQFFWGMPRQEACGLLQEKGIAAAGQSGNSIFFSDTVFGAACIVKLDFTPENLLLNMVSLQWKDAHIGSVIRDAYKKRYGIPSKEGRALFSYRWVEKNSGDWISLDYSGKTAELVFSQGGLEPYR